MNSNYSSMKIRQSSLITHFALLAFLFAILSIGNECIVGYNERVREQQYKLTRKANGQPAFQIMGYHPDSRNLNRILLAIATIFAWGLLIGCSGRLLPAIVYGISLLIALYWLFWTTTNIRYDWELYQDKSLEQLALLMANPFDYLLFILIAFLFLATSIQAFRARFSSDVSSTTK